MRAPKIIRTPGGEELVVLPRAEYEALLARADHEAEIDVGQLLGAARGATLDLFDIGNAIVGCGFCRPVAAGIR
jgi:hypothetical protein